MDKLGVKPGASYSAEDRGDPLKAVIRDLSYLLNIRRRPREEFERFPQLSKSVLTLGIEDYTGILFYDRKDAATRIAVAIRQALTLYEPRLREVTVTPVLDDDTLSFEVFAELRPTSTQDKIYARARLEPGHGNFILRSSSQDE